MRYSHLLFIILVVVVFSAKGQRNKSDNVELTVRDSAIALIVEFGKASNLADDPNHLFGPERPNEMGIKMFRNLFDTINFQDNIDNFIDPRFISVISDLKECSGVDSCIDAIYERWESNTDVKSQLNISTYISLFTNIYATPGISPNILVGSESDVDMSNLVRLYNGEIIKSFGNRFKTFLSVPYHFSGTYIDEDNTPINAVIEELDLIFQISFEKVKNKNKNFYINFKIDKITMSFGTPPPPPSQYLLSFQPFLSVGALRLQNNISDNSVADHTSFDQANNLDFGVLVGRKFKLFSRDYLSLDMYSGITFKNNRITSTLQDGYFENIQRPLEMVPFPAIDDLKEYSIKATVSNTEFIDSYWMVGLPLNVGISFPLNKTNKLGGFLKTGITYYMPISSSTNVEGEIQNVGELYFENSNGQSTTIIIGSEEYNPFNIEVEGKDYYGTFNAYKNEDLEVLNGFESKVEIGFTYKLKGNNTLALGAYYVVGSYSINTVNGANLIEPQSNIISPLNLADKIKYNGFGLSLSVTHDVFK